MAKRKCDAEAPLARKKAKLQQPAVHDALHIHALQSPYSPPLSMASPERQQKRRRTPESDSQSDDTLEQPVAKRARRSQSPESPDASSEPWPSIEYNPCEEEPNWMEQLYVRSHMEAVLFHEEYDSDTSAHHQDALPSPEPSDRDLTESDEWEFPTVDSIKAPQSTPKTCRLLSRQRRRQQRIQQRRQQRNATPQPPPLQRKHRQPPPKMDKDGKRNKRSKEALSPAVETFLHSKRSSRRDANCKLWQLGDDGTACTVSRVR